MRRKFAAASLLAAVMAVSLLTAGCGVSAELPKDALAKVGSVEITQKQFDAQMAMFKGIYDGQVPDEQKDPSAYKNFEAFVLDEMVTYEIAKEKATSLGVTAVSDSDVQSYVANFKKNNFQDDQTKFDAALKSSGLTLAELEAYYSQQMLIQRVSSAVTKNVASPSDAEISAYYDSHKSTFLQQETRTARHILITPATSNSSTSTTVAGNPTAGASDADWAAALATAQKVRADLVGGADWKTEAAQYSNDSGTKDKGGDLGTVTKGEMVAEFDTAVFSLAKDEISQPVKTVYGYHIIQVTGINAAQQQTLDQAKATIVTAILKLKKNDVWNAWLAQAKTDLKVMLAKGMETTTTTTAAASAGTPPTTSTQETTTTG